MRAGLRVVELVEVVVCGASRTRSRCQSRRPDVLRGAPRNRFTQHGSQASRERCNAMMNAGV